MEKKSNRFYEWLQSTTTVGVVATLLFTYSVFNYYTEKYDLSIEDGEHSLTFKVLEFVDQKTLDFRLRLRGQMEGKEKVAVLAIDDASLNQVGRWPWSRETMGQLVDTLMQQGAKNLAFDMVFSEPQEEKAIKVVESMEQKSALSSRVAQEIKAQLNPDQVFADVLNKHREKLVMGAFYDGLSEVLDPYQNLCYTEAFKRSQGYVIREAEEWPPFIFNEFYHNSKSSFVFENTPFDRFFQPLFEKIEAEERQRFIEKELFKNSQSKLNTIEQAQVTAAKEKALRHYCSTWLNPKADRFFDYWEKSWPKLFEENKVLANTTLRGELDKLRGYIFINPIMQTGRWTVDIPLLTKASAHFGMFAAFLDADGTIRRSPLFYRAGARQEDLIPSLALQTYLISTGYQAYLTLDKDRSDLFGSFENRQFAVSKLEIKDPETDQVKFSIPVDHRGRIYINYTGAQMSYPHLPASELFHSRPKIKIYQQTLDPKTQKYRIEEKLVDRSEFIKDRIFVVGATAVGVYDLRVTPFEENFPGVETHVNVLGNLLSQNFLRAEAKEFPVMIIALLLLGFLSSYLINHLGAISGMITTLVLMLAILFVDKVFLFQKGIVAASAFLVIEVTIIYVTTTFVKYFFEERKKKYLKATFSKYVSPAIVEEILKDPENVQLGGKKQRMSVMFSDVRGFTTISEKLDPQMLANVLTEYLTPMTYIVFNNKGTLDKYMGDAIMAFFGAPVAYDDHAKYACRCALQSIQKLKDIQEDFKKRGYPLIDIGIGINTSDMSVGNMGSDIVRSYTVMGDGVNLGSRLEGINKEYGTRIIISEFTHEDVKSEFTCREVDWVRVKGKLQPIKIYELISEGPPSAAKRDMIVHFNSGYGLYHQKNFNEALAHFQRALDVEPEDPVSKLYVERCLEFMTDPPPDNWDGVFVMKTK
ncbi:MAG: adenylate cyclase [Pseudomonadota bacterium]|jgi:adenylate cyclase